MSRSQIWDGTAWVSMNADEPTAPVFDLLNSVKDSADTPDDEFESTTLDAKWTAVQGSSGTVDIAETGEVAKYDLATRPGWLLIQGGSASGQDVELRQDWTMGDGESIVAALSFGVASIDGATGIALDEQRFGIGINDSDTSHTSGNYLRFHWGTIGNGYRINAYDGTTLYATSDFDQEDMDGTGASVTFFRIDRDGLVYRFYFSKDGSSWVPIGSKTFGSAVTNLWLFGGAFAAGGEPVPIHAVKWIRQGTGGALDPWDPNARVAINTVSNGAEVRLTSTQSVADSTWADIDWDAQEYDDDDYWEGVTNPERITFPSAGRYMVIANPIFAGNASNDRHVRLIRNGNTAKELAVSSMPATGTVDTRYQVSAVVNAATDDYIVVQAYQDSGGALNLVGAGSVGDDAETTRLWVYRI